MSLDTEGGRAQHGIDLKRFRTSAAEGIVRNIISLKQGLAAKKAEIESDPDMTAQDALDVDAFKAKIKTRLTSVIGNF